MNIKIGKRVLRINCSFGVEVIKSLPIEDSTIEPTSKIPTKYLKDQYDLIDAYNKFEQDFLKGDTMKK